jgi:hypothetical protein
MKKDIFAMLQEDSLPEPAAAGALPVINLWWASTYYLMFFTFNAEQFASHYDDDEKYYLCLGEGCCPACKANLRATEHVYLPTWDALSRRVAVLKFLIQPDGPAAKILPFLKRYKDRLADVVAVVECKGKGEFAIAAHEPLPETDRGALVCREFCEGLEDGTIDLRDCVKRLTPEQVAALASVKKRLTPVVGRVVTTATNPSPPGPPAPEGKEV